MSEHIEAAARQTSRNLLRVWAFILTMVFWVLGLAGCCRDIAAEYGVLPLYGMIVPDYGVIPSEFVEQEKTPDSDKIDFKTE